MTDGYTLTRPDTYEMQIHGHRPGDEAARQKRLAELALPEKPGIIAGRELRPGDKVACRLGDIIAGVCNKGQTAREADIQREARVITQEIRATMQREMLSMAAAVKEEAGRTQEIARAWTAQATPTETAAMKEEIRRIQEMVTAASAQATPADWERARKASEEIVDRMRQMAPMAPMPQ